MSFRDSLRLAALTLSVPCLGLQSGCAQQPSSESTRRPESHPLEGTWEADGKSGKIRVTIEGNSLYFYERPDFQYDTTFKLIPGSDPAELHATILDTPRTTDSVGDVVTAIYAFQDGTLRLAAIDKVEGRPASFDNPLSDYRLERVLADE